MITNQARKVLIVEDEEIIARNIERSLSRLGYHVTGLCSNADGAMEAVRADKPDVVLMDIHLEGSEDGVVLAERLRDLFAIPVIYLSALMDDETLERAKISQPFGYIAKPFSQRELQITLEIALYKSAMERRLAEQEIHIQHIMDASSQGFCLLDQAGAVRYANNTLVVLTGLEMAALIGSQASEWLMIPHQGDGSLYDAWKDERPCEVTIISAGGKVHRVIVSPRRFGESEGAYSGVFLSIMDVDSVTRNR